MRRARKLFSCGRTRRKTPNPRHSDLARHINVRDQSLGLHIIKALNVPHFEFMIGPRLYVYVQVIVRGVIVASSATRPLDGKHPVWDSFLSLPGQSEAHSSQCDTFPVEWDVEHTEFHIELWDTKSKDMAGSAVVLLRELLSEFSMQVIMWNNESNAVHGSTPPFYPCKVEIGLWWPSVPTSWPDLRFLDTAVYPRHVFMLTRGTRGDVQPFVALARGMAEMHGWLVTICTEMCWKKFVMQNSTVTQGKIQFRCSGGDTEKYLGSWIAQWATQHTSELIQMSMLAASEAFFFESTSTFLDQVISIGSDPRQQSVDLLVYGFTVSGIALTVGEYCKVPICGFILQPSCIPSRTSSWTAVQAITTHSASMVDRAEEAVFTSHSTLGTLKAMFENNPFGKWTLAAVRKHLGLRPVNTWSTLQAIRSPIVIPIKEGTFERPPDWWDNVWCSDFIFLRSRASSGHEGGPLLDFIANARSEGFKLCVVTFSSMQVSRKTVLRICTRMVNECKFNVCVIYVGKRCGDNLPVDLEQEAERQVVAKRFLDLERADFGMLFKYMDCFVVHGGLGTTIEALRMKKPCVVTGPLLMDQRFWGNVCHTKGVGPEVQHIEMFRKTCVEFVNGALDPADPYSWQANALAQEWGDEEDDGLATNAQIFKVLFDTEPKYPGPPKPQSGPLVRLFDESSLRIGSFGSFGSSFASRSENSPNQATNQTRSLSQLVREDSFESVEGFENVVVSI